MRLAQQYENAIAIINQINNNEWEFKGYYNLDFTGKFTCYRAVRNKDGLELWVASGFLSCKIIDKPWELGIFGALVWFFAAKNKVSELEKNMRRHPTDLTKRVCNYTIRFRRL